MWLRHPSCFFIWYCSFWKSCTVVTMFTEICSRALPRGFSWSNTGTRSVWTRSPERVCLEFGTIPLQSSISISITVAWPFRSASHSSISLLISSLVHSQYALVASLMRLETGLWPLLLLEELVCSSYSATRGLQPQPLAFASLAITIRSWYSVRKWVFQILALVGVQAQTAFTPRWSNLPAHHSWEKETVIALILNFGSPPLAFPASHQGPPTHPWIRFL